MQKFLLWACLLALGIGCASQKTNTPDITRTECFPRITMPDAKQATVAKSTQRFVAGLNLSDAAQRRLLAKNVLKAPQAFTAPATIDNSAYVSAILNQGDTPECAARSEAAVLSASYWREKNVKLEFDAPKMYRRAKFYDKNNEPGTTLDSMLHVVTTESFIPTGEIPTITTESLLHTADLPFAIHKRGFLWVGLQITDAWMNCGSDGRIADGGKLLGGHAVVVVGYSIPCQTIKILNSWGPGWGDKGFCYLSFAEFERELGYGLVQTIEWFAQEPVNQ